MNQRLFLRPALIAGAVTGLLGNLPILNLVNCIFCVFAWLGGALAVWLYKREQSNQPSLSTGQAAGLGALTGLLGAVIGVIVYVLTGPISNSLFTSILTAMNVQGNLPFKTDYGSILIGAVIFFFADAVLYSLFGAISAIITASVLWKKPASASVPQPPNAAV